MDEYTVKTGDTPSMQENANFVSFSQPEYSEWSVKTAGVTYHPQKGEEPNWFWRLTQRLVFGFVCVKDR